MQDHREILILFYDRMCDSPLELETFAVPGVRWRIVPFCDGLMLL
jgi:hypothetical protein